MKQKSETFTLCSQRDVIILVILHCLCSVRIFLEFAVLNELPRKMFSVFVEFYFSFNIVLSLINNLYLWKAVTQNCSYCAN